MRKERFSFVFGRQESSIGQEKGLGKLEIFVSPLVSWAFHPQPNRELKVVNGFVCPFVIVLTSMKKYSSFLIIVWFGD